ncbi:MAG: hypothetical protein ACI32N_01285 [Bulleidia sp.]
MVSGLLIVLALAAAAGIVVCFHGQKMLAAAFAILTFIFTYQLLSSQWGTSPTGLVAALAVSVVAVLLVAYAQAIAFFLIGFLCGVFIGRVVVGFLPVGEQYIQLLIILSFGLILGFLGKHYQKGIIRILTGICGGYFLALFTLMLTIHVGNLAVFDMGNLLDTATNMIDYMFTTLMNSQPLYVLVLTIVYSVCGILYQNRHK